MTHFRLLAIRSLALCFTFFIPALSFAQVDFQGEATYQSKTTPDVGDWAPKEMSPEQKKRMEDRMKAMFEKTYILRFNKAESTYKEEEKLEAPGGGGGFKGFMSSFTAGAQYKNVKDNEFLQDQEFFGKQFLIKEPLQKLQWKMTGETKMIGQYLCMKATAMKPVDEMDFMNMRRRRGRRGEDRQAKVKDSTNQEQSIQVQDSTAREQSLQVQDSTKTEVKNFMDEVEVPKEIEVVAWYTMQIPVNQGPGEYWGLPGLILEISAGKTTILCSKIVMNPAEKKEIKKPSKGQEVTKAEYNAIIKKKMEEMRQMFGGRNRGQRGGGRGH